MNVLLKECKFMQVVTHTHTHTHTHTKKKYPFSHFHDQIEMWLDPSVPYQQALRQLKACDTLAWHAVDPKIGNIRVNEADCISVAKKKPEAKSLLV